MSTTAADRPVTTGNPLRLFFSAAPWRGTLYLLSYLVCGPALFVVTLVVCVLGYGLSIAWLGLPLLVGAAGIVRGCAQFERHRAGLVGPTIPSSYRPVDEPGLLAQIKTRWGDPAARRDCAYLLVLFVPLMLLDAIVSIAWLVVLGLATLPLWYYAVPQNWDNGTHTHGVMIGYRSAGPHRGRGFGWWIGDLPSALLAAAVFLVVAVLAGYVVVRAARLHARMARALLGPYVDPLAAAKQMLSQPALIGH